MQAEAALEARTAQRPAPHAEYSGANTAASRGFEFVAGFEWCSTIIESVPLPSARYEKNPSFVSRRIADEMLLVPIHRSVDDVDCLYALNAVAARVWDLIDVATSVTSVRDTIVAEFEVEAWEADRDVGVLIDQLASIGALRAASA